METLPFYGQRNKGSEKTQNLPEGTQVGRAEGGTDPGCLAPNTRALAPYYRMPENGGENLQLNAS